MGKGSGWKVSKRMITSKEKGNIIDYTLKETRTTTEEVPYRR
jgi:hypothetical protein